MFKRIIVLFIILMMVVPMNAYAGTYSYNDIGSANLTRTVANGNNVNFYIDYNNPVDRKLLGSYDISAPTNGGQIMRIEGSVGATADWYSGFGGEDFWRLEIIIYGKRADGSLGDNIRKSWAERYDPLTPQSFNASFFENYPKLYVEVWMSLVNGESNKVSHTSSKRLNYVTVNGNAQCFTGIYGIDKSEVDNIILNTQNAVTASNGAKTAATSALTAANNANVNASNAYNSVHNSNGNTITAVRDSGGTVLLEARQAKTNSENAYNTALAVSTKIDSLSNAVTNIQNNLGADTSPPSIEITTVSGALATSAASIRAVINASDNVSTFFEYSLDGAWYQTLPQDGVISLPLSRPGSNLVTVWVRDEAGNIGRESITIRKL